MTTQANWAPVPYRVVLRDPDGLRFVIERNAIGPHDAERQARTDFPECEVLEAKVKA